MNATPKRKPEAPEPAPKSAPAKPAAESGARTLSQKLWGTADAGLTTDEIMAMTRGRD